MTCAASGADIAIELLSNEDTVANAVIRDSSDGGMQFCTTHGR